MSLILLVWLFIFLSASESKNLQIVGGQDAQEGQFPYQVSLQLCVLDFCEHRCGGVLVSSTWVLTAAGCIYSSDIAVIGTFNLSNTQNATTVAVVAYVVHENYDSDLKLNDIALLFLEKPVEFSDLIQPAKLADETFIPAGFANLSSWGSVDGDLEYTDILQIAPELPLLQFEECLSALETILDLDEEDIGLTKDGNICTGPLTGGTSACVGDIGAPLLQDNLVIGVTSWYVEPCGIKGAPSVYTNVAKYSSWIRENTNNFTLPVVR